MGEREREWEREGGRKLRVLRRGSEEQADVGGLLVIKGHRDVQAWAVAKGHVWVMALMQQWWPMLIDVHGSCYH